MDVTSRCSTRATPSGHGRSRTPTRSSGPGPDLNAGRSGVPHRVARDRPQRDEGAVTWPTPRRTSSAPSWRSTAAGPRRATSTRPSTRSPSPTRGSTRRSRARAPKPKFTAASRARWTLSLLFDRRSSPTRRRSATATALLLDAMEVPAGAAGGGADRRAPVHHVRLGRLTFKARLHELTGTYKLFEPERRADPRRREVSLKRRTRRPRPQRRNRARTRPRARPPASACTPSRTATRCPRSPTAPTATPTGWRADRRGQRHRQPAAPAPRQLALPAEARA